MFSLSIVLLISRLWRQIGISYQTALKSGFDVWSESFRFSWKAFFRSTGGQAIVPCPVFSHFLLSAEKGKTQTQKRALGENRRQLRGKHQKLITLHHRPIRWLFFAINYTAELGPRGSLRKKREVNKTYTEIGKTKDGTQTHNYAVIYKHWKNERSCGCIENGQSSFYQIRD